MSVAFHCLYTAWLAVFESSKLAGQEVVYFKNVRLTRYETLFSKSKNFIFLTQFQEIYFLTSSNKKNLYIQKAYLVFKKTQYEQVTQISCEMLPNLWSIFYNIFTLLQEQIVSTDTIDLQQYI